MLVSVIVLSPVGYCGSQPEPSGDLRWPPEIFRSPPQPQAALAPRASPEVAAGSYTTPWDASTEAVGELKIAEAMATTGDHTMAAWVKRDAMKKIDPLRKSASLEAVRATGALAEHFLESGKGEVSVRLVDTAVAPSLLAASAQHERMKLAEGAGCLELSADVAATIRPENSIERMLGDQMAATHALGMRLIEKANGWLQAAEKPQSQRADQAAVAAVEAARLTNAAARAMSAFNDGAATLAKLRNGGQQQVTVTHVHQQIAVGDGGQAVVAGMMDRGRGKKGRGTQ